MSSRFIDQFKTIPEMLERTARVYADREAYKWFEHRTNEWVGITWRQFSERVMRWRIETIRSQGTPAEIEVFPGLAHGFGLGTGTSAEGWLDHAVAFWEENT